MKRIINLRNSVYRIFIYSQGTVTEPAYFKFLRTKCSRNVKITIESKNISNSIKFINYGINNYKREIEDCDEFWFVFDKDNDSVLEFNKAIDGIKNPKCHSAYSNQAFEIWFIYHFQSQNSILSRDKYSEVLSKYLKFEYSKDSKAIDKIVKLLFEYTDIAIMNADNSLNHHNSEKRKPAESESSTTVHLLVKKIQNYFNT